MINELLSRPNIQSFLNKYPSNRWKELIADLFEIGVLNLRNSYHRDEYSKKEFNALIYDLQNSPYQTQYQNQPPRQNYYEKNSYAYPPKKQYNYSMSNMSDYNCNNCNNYDFERRKRRIKKLKQHASTSQMDAFYSEKNVVYPNQVPTYKERRSHQQIMDQIARSRKIRDIQRYQIKDLKMQYLQGRKEELNHKRMEKIIERQAEQDIKDEENEKRRIKQEEDYQEGYGEDYIEEDENEEEEETDKYNDYNRGYDDEEGEGEENYEEQNYEAQGEYQGYQGQNQNAQNYQNMPMPQN